MLTCVTATWVRVGPLSSAVLQPSTARAYVLLDRNGLPLGATSDFPATDSRANTLLLNVRADRLAAATVVAEDRRFFSHTGVDPLALMRTVGVDATSGRLAQGGSTITQQLVKLRLGRPPRTIRNKVREMIDAERLEHRLTKSQILSAYLAEAPYGGPIIGAERAALAYFDKPVSQLSWAQAAYLAAIPNRPSAFNPRVRPSGASKRQQAILHALRVNNTITVGEYQAAMHEPNVLSTSNQLELAPHFTEMLRSRLERTHAPTGRTMTTLDAPLQRDVEGIVRHSDPLLHAAGASNVAVVVLDNRTGAVRAWQGSREYFDWDHGGMIDAALVRRQTGSTIKPFVYALAFEHGALPSDPIDDAPTVFPGNGVAFQPENYDHTYRGIVTMREALASSINVPAVRLANTLGVTPLAALMQRADLRLQHDPGHYGLSLALGAGELDLVSLTSAYASFARSGRNIGVRMLESEPILEGRQVVSSDTAFLVTDVLSDNDARTPAFGAHSVLRFPFPVAAKTGTSQNFHDNWVIGYTADITVGVWVGNLDRKALKGATGVSGAGPIFHAVMVAAHERLRRDVRGGSNNNSSVLRAPADLQLVETCAGATCDTTTSDYIRRRTASSRTSVAASVVASNDLHGEDPPLTLIEPRASGHYLIQPDRPPSSQRLPLIASGGAAPYAFVVDGVMGGQHSWPLLPGRHRACVRDAVQHSACEDFQVDTLAALR